MSFSLFNVKMIAIFPIVSFNYYYVHYFQNIYKVNLVKVQFIMTIITFLNLCAKTLNRKSF